MFLFVVECTLHLGAFFKNTMEFKHPERRKEQRRQTASDRRAMIRFELEKTPRRSGKDRRLKDVWAGRDKY